MNKKIYIINGYPESGKDTFVKMVAEASGKKVYNYHASDRAKIALKMLGWDGLEKTDSVRDALSAMVTQSRLLFDGVFEYFHRKVFYATSDSVVFLHEREPNNIERLKKEFGASAILISRREAKKHLTNEADSSVSDYNGYDILIMNDGTLEELKDKARAFVKIELRGEQV